MLAVVIAEGVAIAVLALLVLGLLRSHALILRALNELGAGLELEGGTAARPAQGATGPVPVDIESGVVPATRPETVRAAAISGQTLAGEELVISVAGPGRRTLLAFLSSGCSVCQAFWSQFAAGQVQVPGDARLVVVVKDAHEESPSQLAELAGASSYDVVQSSAAWTDYGVPGSPYFVYVEDARITGEGSSTTWRQVSDLMTQAVRDAAHAGGAGGAGTAVGGDRDGAPVDRELLGAGIRPGHPSLYTDPDEGSQ